jgi:hypothetical protein
LRAAFANRFAGVTREGGVSLGESSYLVNAVWVATPPEKLVFVVPDKTGFYSLPVWVDHVAAGNTVVDRFRIDDEAQLVSEMLPKAWFRISLAPLPSTVQSKTEKTPERRKV